MGQRFGGASRYDKQPSVAVPGTHRVWTGAEAWQEVDRHARDGGRRAPLVVVDTYPGVDLAELVAVIRAALPHYVVINVEDAAAKPIREIDALIAPNLTDDRVFGVISHHDLDEFYDADRLASIADRVLDSNTPDGADRLGRRAGADPPLDSRARRPGPLGDPAAPARGRAELALRQRRRGRPAQVQARLLRRVAHRRPAQARAVRRRWTSCSTRNRSAADGNADHRRRRSAPAWRPRPAHRSGSSRSSTPASGAASG